MSNARVENGVGPAGVDMEGVDPEARELMVQIEDNVNEVMGFCSIFNIIVIF